MAKAELMLVDVDVDVIKGFVFLHFCISGTPWFFMVFGWFPWFFKVVSWFIILLLVNVPEMQKMSSRNTKMQKNKSFNSVVQPTSTSTSTNISSAFAIDVSGCAHSHHGVLNLDHHRQELSQLPGQRQPHN